jgi:hypothetical protein
MGSLDDAIAHVIRLRGVQDPCAKCHGLGVYAYASGATWRGGMGTASIEYDVCSVCWGSGDKYRRGVDLRAITAERQAWDERQVIGYLSRRLGVDLGDTAQYVRDLADLADKEARRRKIPDGKREFWWRRSWEMLASMLRDLAKQPPPGDEEGR